MPDGNSPLLTPTQWDALKSDAEMDAAHQRTHRSRARKRVREIIGDFPLLFEHLPEEDRRQMFDPARGSRSDRADTMAEAYSGRAALLAFLYETASYSPGGEFEDLLQNALHRVADRNGWVVEEFDLTVEFDTDPDFERKLERFQEGDATVNEATLLLQRGLIETEEFTAFVKREFS